MGAAASAPRGLVVELADGDVAAGYCGRMLRTLGFRVVKVEPPPGDRLRMAPPLLDGAPDGAAGSLFQYLHAGKHSIVADGDELDRLLAAADIVLLAANGDASAVDARQAALAARTSVVRVVTSPFGLTGPYRDVPHDDLIDWAASGYLFITGSPDREPLQGGGPFVASATGLVATIGALAAWRDARAGGPRRLVDVSAFDVMAGLHQFTFSQYTTQGYVKRRAANRHPEAHHPVAFLEASDGWVCICAPSAGQWTALAHAVGMPELDADPRFRTAGERYDHADAVDAALRPWLMSHTAAEVARIMQDAHVPASPVMTMQDVAGDQHLRARGFLCDVKVGSTLVTMAGASVLIGEQPEWTAAPDLGADTVDGMLDGIRAVAPPARAAAPRALLDGVRVLDLTRAWAGPIGGRFLADLGADVIHVEYDTARGGGVYGPNGEAPPADPMWTWGELPSPALRGGVFPNADPGAEPWNRQTFFNKLHRNKRSLCVDLTAPDGAQLFRDLVAISDVVLENYSPRAARKLGLTFEDLRTVNPEIVVVSVSGYGHSGPDHDRVALGPIIEAESGLAALTGYRGGGPMKFGAALSDPVAGLNGAIAVVAALAERDATGVGQYVDVAMLEASVAIGGDALLATSANGTPPERRGNHHPRHAPSGVHRCAGDDEWIAISCRTTEEYHALAAVVGAASLTDPRLDDLAERQREQPYLDRTIGAWTATQTKWSAWQTLRDAGVTSMPVMNAGDLVHDPHLASHGFMVELISPAFGANLQPGLQLRFDPPLDVPMVHAALLGADNEEVLRDLLHYDAARIADLQSRRVVSTGPAP